MHAVAHKLDTEPASSQLPRVVLSPGMASVKTGGIDCPGLELVEEGWIVSRCPTSVQNQIENAEDACGIDVSVRAEFLAQLVRCFPTH